MKTTTEGETNAKSQENEGISEQRRQFLKTASKAAATAPAVTLLLAASAKPRQASASIYDGYGDGYGP